MYKFASQKRFESRLERSWPAFLAKRRDRLRQQGRVGDAGERKTASIVEDIPTIALDWKVDDINKQVLINSRVGRPDIVLTRLGTKCCVIETKPLGSFTWNQTAVQQRARKLLRSGLPAAAVHSVELERRASLSEGVI